MVSYMMKKLPVMECCYDINFVSVFIAFNKTNKRRQCIIIQYEEKISLVSLHVLALNFQKI